MMLNDELTTAIIAAVVGAISGGIVNFLLELRRDRRNDKKEKIKEKQNVYKNRPELDIVKYEAHQFVENIKDVPSCDIEIFVAVADHFEYGKNASAVYNKNNLDRSEWCCFTYVFKNMGLTDINSMNVLMADKRHICLFGTQEIDYLLSQGAINYSICYDKKLRVGETVSLKLLYNKNHIPIGAFSALMLLGLRDDNGRIWEQPFFAPNDKVYESHEISHKEYSQMLRSDDVYDELERIKS